MWWPNVWWQRVNRSTIFYSRQSYDPMINPICLNPQRGLSAWTLGAASRQSRAHHSTNWATPIMYRVHVSWMSAILLARGLCQHVLGHHFNYSRYNHLTRRGIKLPTNAKIMDYKPVTRYPLLSMEEVWYSCYCCYICCCWCCGCCWLCNCWCCLLLFLVVVIVVLLLSLLLLLLWCFCCFCLMTFLGQCCHFFLHGSHLLTSGQIDPPPGDPAQLKSFCRRWYDWEEFNFVWLPFVIPCRWTFWGIKRHWQWQAWRRVQNIPQPVWWF